MSIKVETRINSRIIFGLWLLVILVASGSSLAQVTTARLEGQVKDASQAIIPGVTVIAINNGTNLTTEAVTNETGLYIFSRLSPGTYTVTAELTGFKKAVNQEVKLEVGDTRSLNITWRPVRLPKRSP